MEAFAAFDAFLLILWILLLSQVRLRSMLLLSSLLSVPLVVLATLLQPDYYDPPAFTSAPIDIERLIFLFLAGGIAATIYPALSRQYFLPISNGRNMWPERVFVPLGIIMIILLPPALFHWSAMHALVLGEVVGVLLVIWIGRDLRNIMLGSALLSGLGYFMLLKLWSLLFPDVLELWNPEAFWGIHVLSVPLGELVLALLFGALWGPLVALIFHRHLTRQTQP